MFAFNLLSQPFLGHYFGFHIFFTAAFLGIAHFFCSWVILDKIKIMPHTTPLNIWYQLLFTVAGIAFYGIQHCRHFPYLHITQLVATNYFIIYLVTYRKTRDTYDMVNHALPDKATACIKAFEHKSDDCRFEAT